MLPALHLMAVTAITIIFYNNSLLRHSRLQHFSPFAFFLILIFFNPLLPAICTFRGFPLLHNALPLRYNAQSLSSSHSPFSLSFARDGGGGRCDSCYCGAKGCEQALGLPRRRSESWLLYHGAVCVSYHGSFARIQRSSLASLFLPPVSLTKAPTGIFG